MSLDVSKLSATPDYSSLLNNSIVTPRKGGAGGLSGDLISQWSMLRSNGKALKAAIRAEERGYLRDGDGPKQQLMSEKFFAAEDRSTTVADVLAMLGRKPTATTEEGAADGTAAAADGSGSPSSAEGLGDTVDVEA